MWDQAYGTENSVAMADDGLNGDVFAGDGIFTGQIPGAFMQTLAESQMFRWRIQATDTLGNASKDPPFIDPLDNEQYFGTITQTPSIASNLPVLV